MHAGNLDPWPLGIGAQSTFAGQDIFYQNYVRKINKIPEFYTTFSKNAKILHYVWPNNIFAIFFWGGRRATSCPPSDTPMDGPQASHQLNPALCSSQCAEYRKTEIFHPPREEAPVNRSLRDSGWITMLATSPYCLSNAIPCKGQNIKSLCGVCVCVSVCVCARAHGTLGPNNSKRAGDRGLVTMGHQ